MSHFYTIVLLKKDRVEALDVLDNEMAIRAALDETMEPYNENTEVPPYQEECHCVGWAAKSASREIVEKSFPIEKLREHHAAWCEKNPPETEEDHHAAQEHWESLIKPRQEAEKAAYENHVLFNKPDAKCSECGGTGKHESTYNPKSKWDWFRIGGRWDGALARVDVEGADGGFNFDDSHEGLERNAMPVEDLLKEWNPTEDTPFAIVTSDGEWNEKGEMGWWGMSRGDKDPTDWREQVLDILKAHTDCIAVGVDCHI